MLKKLVNLSIKRGYIKLAILLKVAGKIDDLKKQLPDRAEEIDVLADADPSPTKKYLDWAVKQLIAGKDILDVSTIIKDFHNLVKRLDNKDINQYTFDKLNEALEKLRNTPSKTQQKQQVKTEGAERIYESDRFVVVYPKTKAAVCAYGKGTQWCITQQDARYFEDYTEQGIVFYFIIDKYADNTEPMKKIAIGYANSHQIAETYNANDVEISMDDVKNYLGNDFDAINSAIMRHAGTTGMKDARQVMKDIAKNGTLDQRQNLARSESTPSDILKILMNDKNADVRVDLASNIKCPDEILQKLAFDTDDMVKNWAISNPNFPNHLLIELSKSKNLAQREGVALNIATPPDILVDLANDKSVHVRSGVASNPSAPPEVLLRLSKNKNMATALANNPSTPYEALVNVISSFNGKYWNKDTGRTMNILVAIHRDNKDLMYDFANQKDVEYRLLVARHSDDEEILNYLTKDNDFYVRVNLAVNHEVPQHILAKLMRDPDYRVRREVIRNPNTDKSILIDLSENDTNKKNRILAGDALRGRNDLLNEANSIFTLLIKLANTLDQHLQIKIADEIDVIVKKRFPQQQIANDYLPLGQQGDEYGGNATQENEVTEELNEEMEARDMENYTPGQDNLIINKNDNPGDKWGNG
jgi:hypothetical protein